MVLTDNKILAGISILFIVRGCIGMMLSRIATCPARGGSGKVKLEWD